MRDGIERRALFMRDMIQIVNDNLNPEDVFSREALVEWAEDEGFVSAKDHNAKIEKILDHCDREVGNPKNIEIKVEFP